MEIETQERASQIKCNARLVLQERDIDIIRCCYEQQFLVHEQIARFFYAGRHERNARNRIGKLKKAGFLKAERHVGLSSTHLLRVTEAGRALAAQQSPYDVTQAKTIDVATLLHDRIVTDVRLRLRTFWDGIWVPEKAMKDKYRVIPDGLFQFSGTGHVVAIEVENSLKGRHRFGANLSEWQRIEDVSLVLFVATTAKLFESIRAFLALAPARPAFGVVLLVDFMSAAAPVVESPKGRLALFNKRVL